MSVSSEKQDTEKSIVVHWRILRSDADAVRRMAVIKRMSIGNYVGSLAQAALKRVSK